MRRGIIDEVILVIVIKIKLRLLSALKDARLNENEKILNEKRVLRLATPRRESSHAAASVVATAIAARRRAPRVAAAAAPEHTSVSAASDWVIVLQRFASHASS